MATQTHDADLAVVGKVSQTGSPSAGGDLITKTYADATYGGTTGTGLKMSEQTVLTAANIAANDKWANIDVSDTTMGAGGTNKVSTTTDLIARLGPVYNASVANQGPGFATDTYVTNSNILIPSGRLQAKSVYRCRINVTKTAAGLAVPIVTIRTGTAGAIGDTSRAALTLGAAGTAVIDEAWIDIECVFRTVGSGTTAVLQSVARLSKGGTTTAGFIAQSVAIAKATSAGFDSTVANLQIGVSYNGGTSAAHTISLVDAELVNLV